MWLILLKKGRGLKIVFLSVLFCQEDYTLSPRTDAIKIVFIVPGAP